LTKADKVGFQLRLFVPLMSADDPKRTAMAAITNFLSPKNKKPTKSYAS